jgi:hypothetical protein
VPYAILAIGRVEVCRFSGMILALSILLLAGALSAQAGASPQEPAKETIKVEAAEVVVDAVVTDRRNRLVSDRRRTSQSTRTE